MSAELGRAAERAKRALDGFSEVFGARPVTRGVRRLHCTRNELTMMSKQRGFQLIPALAVLIFLFTNIQAQSSSPALQELRGNPTLTEALDWVNQAITTYAAVGVYRKEGDKIVSGMSLFKGFKLDHASGCTLYLKNEGIYKETQKTYIYEATIPIADLADSSSRVSFYTSTHPDLDKLYGTWRVSFSTKDNRTTARIYAKDSPQGDFSGSVVEFLFEDKETARVFEKGLRKATKMCQSRK